MFLKCIAGGNPTPEISWELDGKKIANNERYQIGQYVTVNGDVVSYLNISSIHRNDGGLYKCIATSKVGTAEHAAKQNVYGVPYIRPMEKKYIVAGETLVVTCPVAGYPIESIIWERGKGFSNGWSLFTYIFALFSYPIRQPRIADQPKAEGLPERNADHRERRAELGPGQLHLRRKEC